MEIEKGKLLEKYKKKLIISGVVLAIMACIILVALYISNEQVRVFIDRNILRKEVLENDVVKIELNSQQNESIYAYHKYVTILSKNVLTTYSATGKKEYEHEIPISNPIYASNNRFLVIAENKGSELYVVSEANLSWQAQVEGKIEKVNINKNGYVSVIVSGTSYKSVVITFSPQGKELFKTYLSNTIALKAEISNDNKYLSIAEVNILGTLIQSNIKVVSIEKAQNDPRNSVIYNHQAKANELITDIKYQDRARLICMYDSGVHSLKEQNDETILAFEDNKIIAATINLNEHIVYTVEKAVSMFSTSRQVIFKNTSTQKENLYTVNSTIKSIQAYGTHVALNIGTEVLFVDTNGWLKKRYISTQEITDIVLAEQIAIIVYKDKVEIINL